AVGIAEGVGGWGRDDRDVDVNLAVLNRLPAATVRAQNAHAPHLALRAVVAQRAVHRAFDVVDDAFFHQVDGGFLRGEGRARKPQEVFDADFRRSFQHHEGDLVAIPQVVVVGEDHAVTQAALAQGGLEVGEALVAVLGIVFAGADGRGWLADARLVLADSEIGDLRLAVDHAGHGAGGGVLGQFDSVGHEWRPDKSNNHRGYEGTRR